MPAFFDFFNKEKESTLKLDLHDLKKWLDNQTKDLFNDIILQGNDLIKKLMDNIPKAKSAAEDFSNIALNMGELNEPLIPTIKNSKNSIAIKVINTISKLEFAEVENFNDLINISNQLSQSLVQIDQTMKTHGRVVFTILAKEVRPLLSELKQIQREVALLTKLVENNSEKANKIELIHVNISHLLNLNSELLINKDIVNDVTNGSIKVTESEKDIIKKLGIVKSSQQFKESQKNKEEIQIINVKLKQIYAEFDTSFSRLRKPLEKYEYVAQLTDEKKKIIKKYVESPSDGLINDKELSIVIILEGMKETINTNKIIVKNPEKVIRRIDEIQPILSSTQNIMINITKKLGKINSSTNNSIINEAHLLQKNLESKLQSKEKQTLLIEKTQSDINKNVETMKELANNIEIDVKKIFNIKLEINIMTSKND